MVSVCGIRIRDLVMRFTDYPSPVTFNSLPFDKKKTKIQLPSTGALRVLGFM